MSASTPRSHDMATNLMALFPADEHSYIRWQSRSSEHAHTKPTVTVKEALTLDLYAAHLDAASFAGPGAVGVKLSALHDGHRVCQTLVLDLDSTPLAELRASALIDTLQAAELYPYVTRGSTGRGCHIYLFLTTAIRSASAVSHLQDLRRLVLLAFPSAKLDAFPTASANGGRAVYMPYRGASTDGLGANPLLDPGNDYMPVPLQEAAHLVSRSEPTVLSNFRDETPADQPSFQRHIVTIDVGSPSPDARFELEALRVRGSWRLGVRNSLTLGFSAFASSGLHIEGSRIIAVIRKLHRDSGLFEVSMADDEKRLIDAVARTLTRVKAGRPVAWHPYYGAAGVPSPSIGRPREQQQANNDLIERLPQLRWDGRTGLTDQAVYWTLVYLALRVGHHHELGVAVRVSRRDLAIQANVADKTEQHTLKRLKTMGLVTSGHRAYHKDVGSLVLTCSSRSDDSSPQSTPLYSSKGNTVPDWVEVRQHAAFRARCLGRCAGLIVATLTLHASTPIPLTELSEYVQRPARTLKLPLERLTDVNIVDVQGGNVSLCQDARSRLDDVANVRGAIRAAQNQKEGHERERELYRHRSAMWQAKRAA